MIVGSCRIRRKETVRINRNITPMVMVRPLLSLVLIVLIPVTLLLSLSVVLLVMMSGYLILHACFIFALTEIGSVLMSMCRVEMSCVWEIITHVRLWAEAPFGSRRTMA